MSDAAPPRPHKEAARITTILDTVLGADRFDRAPVDVAAVALEYSAQIAPDGPIVDIVEADIEGCVGALVAGETKPRKWAIMHQKRQSAGRRAFTIAHELAHFIMHRQRIETDPAFGLSIYCNDEAVTQRSGTGIEAEADTFAADLLMPFHDFRAQLPAKSRPDFAVLSGLAKRYGVSLAAATLRWLEYTETRAILVVSNEGFAQWAKTSKAALRSGRFVRTRNTVFELPVLATAVTRNFTEETKGGISQHSGVWFPEPVVEMCIRSERYDQEYTLLHFETERVWDHGEEIVSDTFDAFNGLAS